MSPVRTIAVGEPRLAVHEWGQHSAPAVVLVCGVSQTVADWPAALIEVLIRAGFRVIAFDNRDIGLSTRLTKLGPPPLLRLIISAKLGLSWRPRTHYQLTDMADDLAALLDALGIDRAHIVGTSMGGMIAQRLALAHPQRVGSLACIMSSSGAPGLPDPRRDVARQMQTGPARTLEQEIERAIALRLLLAGELATADRSELAQRASRSVSRTWPPHDGPTRQYAAILADRERWKLLGGLRSPTLVVHGDADPLLPVEHGRDLALRIPHARFEVASNMGHEIPHSRADQIAALIVDHAHASREADA